MDILAKVTPGNQPVASGTPIDVTNRLVVAPGDNVALQVRPDMVAGYAREGADLVVQMKTGEALRIANFYAEPNNPAHLFLVDGKEQLIGVDLASSAEGALSASYVPQGVAAEFAAGATEAAGATTGVSAGAGAGEAAAGAAGAGATGGGLSTAAILGGLAVAGGGIAAAASGGGGDDDAAPATPPPTAPTDTTPPPAAFSLAVSAGGTQLTGTAEPGATVRVDVNGDGTPDASATVGADGRFTIPLNPPLTNGETISVTVRDAAGNVSTPATATAPDTTPPPAPTGVTISQDGTTLTGTGAAGSTVRVDTNGDGQPDYTTTVGSNGQFSITLAPPLTDGQTVSVVAADAAGNASTPTSVTAPDTTPPPAPTGVTISPDGTTLSGAGAAGSTITVDTNGDGRPDQTTTVDGNGQFSIPLNPPLTDGQTVTVVAADPAGNASAPTTVSAPDTTPPPAPTGVTISPDGTTLTGTGAVGSTVSVDTNGDGQPDYTAPVDGNGQFSVTLNPPLTDGQSITIVAADAAGNASTAATITAPDTTPPPAPTGVTISPDGTTLTGTGAAGSTIAVDTNGDGRPDYTTTVDGNGQFSVPLDPPLTNGQPISVTASDPTGNTSTPTTVTAPDTTPPPAATAVEVSADGTTLTGLAEAGSTIRIDLNGDGVTDTTTVTGPDGRFTFTLNPPLIDGQTVSVVVADPAGNTSGAVATVAPDLVPTPAAPTIQASNGLTATGSAGANLTVILYGQGGLIVGQTTADANGVWQVSFTPRIGNGVLLSAVAVNSEGEASSAATTLVDAVAPAAPTIDVSNAATLSGTAEAGSTVTVTDGNGATIGTVVADAQGYWSIATPAGFPDGGTVVATATDAVGNVSNVAGTTVDTAPPAAPTVAPTNGAVLTGTAEPASTVTLSAGGIVLGSVLVDDNGNWSFVPVPALANGTTVTATATDAAGNPGPGATIAIDTTPPGVPIFQASNGDVISGTAEANAIVTLTSGGQLLAQVRADGNGAWSYDPPGLLPNGALVQATATDAAGNVSLTSALVVDSLPPAAPVVLPTNGAQITGTGEPGSTIIVLGPNGLVGTVQVDAGGNWTILPATPPADGDVLSVTAGDAAGNVSTPPVTVTVDAIPPFDPILAPTNGNVIVGLAEANALVTLYAGGQEIGTVRVDAQGTFTFDPPGTLPDGTLITAVATDAAGNASQAGSIVSDNTLPSIPTIDPSNGVSVGGLADPNITVIILDAGGVEIARVLASPAGTWNFTFPTPVGDGVVIRALAESGTGVQTAAASIITDAVAPGAPTIDPSNGTVIGGLAEAGATVLVYLGNNPSPIGQTTADANGRWTLGVLPAPADGTAITAIARDAAGNSSLAATGTVDAVAPGAPLIAATNGASVSGTAEANATVVLTDANGQLLATVQADGSGNWSAVLPVTQPDGAVIQATARDLAGNVSVPANAVVDAVAPTLPTINPSNGSVVTGTGEVGALVVIGLGNGIVIGSAVVDANGNWSFTPTTPIANATLIDARAVDAAGNASAQVATVTDSLAPGRPVIVPTDGSRISGTAEANATVVLTDSNGTPFGQVQCDSGGNWSWTPPTPLADGVAVFARAIDAAGNASLIATAVVDDTPPSAPVIQPSNGTVLVGTAEAGATVSLTLADGTPLGTTVADGNGSWTLNLVSPLANLTVVNATATDATGNVSAAGSVTVDTVAPNTPSVILSNGTSFSGNSDTEVIVILQEGGGVIARVTPDANGNWTYTPPTPLVNGSTVVIVARDEAGNFSSPTSVIVDSIPPAAPGAQPTNGITLAGTAEAGATITLTGPGGVPIATTVADAGGNWSVTPAVRVADATQVTVTATDPTGNVSPPTTVTVDGLAPAIPTLALSNGTVLSGTAEADATVTLTDPGGTVIGTAVADINGNWSLVPGTPLTNGTVVTASASDAVGNASGSVSVTIDSVAPGVPVIRLSDGSPISGTAEANATITLTDTQGNAIGTTTADVNGNWSVTPTTPVPDGTIVLAVATDATGNASGFAATTIDSVAPNAPTIDLSRGVALSGTAEAGATVTLSDGAAFTVSVIADANGGWSYTPGTPIANATVITATATDATGNVSAPASTTIDSVAPGAPVIAPSNGTNLAGTAEAGALVTLTIGGTTLATVTADAGGNWAFTPPSPLGGNVVVSATATDPYGNVSVAGTVTTDTSLPTIPVINASNGVTIGGTADVGDTLTVTANGTTIGTINVGAGGTWSITPPSPLADGTVLVAIARNPAGTDSAPATILVDAVAPPVPVVALSNGTIVQGLAEAGALVTLTIGGSAIASVAADATGRWSYAPTTPLANGVVVGASASDAAGNASGTATVTVDAIAPGAPVINPSSGTLLTGTAEANALVTLTVAGVVLGQVTADGNGSWGFTPATALANGAVVSATATDAAGNVGVTASVTIDTIAPSAATGLTFSSDGTTLTGTAEAGATVRVVVEGIASPITVTAGAGGTFTVPFGSPLLAGQDVSVVVVDPSGNVSPPTLAEAPDRAPLALTVPETADGYLNSAEASDGIQVSVGLTPGTDAGDTITVRFAGQNGYVADYAHVVTASERASGAFNLTLAPPQGQAAFPQGAATITATSSDGPVSNSVGFTVDTVPPRTPVLSLVGNLLNVSGEPNSALTVQVNLGGVVATAQLQTDNNGLASVDLLTGLSVQPSWSQLLNSSVSVRGQDAAGNVSNIATVGINPADQLVTIGNFGLDVGLLPAKLGFSGNTEVGSTMRVEITTPAATAIVAPQVDASGHFAVNLLSAQVLSQLGLSVTGLLNLGAGIGINLVSTDAEGHDSARYGLTLAGSGLSLNIGAIDITGTAGADILGGSSGAEHFVAGAGADLIYAVGAGDRVEAGAGNDTIQLTATNFTSVDGGTGFDTILLTNGIDIDYNAPGVGTWTNIERIDLGRGDSGSTLTLTAAEVNAVTDANHTLQITGEANDQLVITGAVDTGTSQVIDGLSYHVYTFGGATVLVEDNSVTVVH